MPSEQGQKAARDLLSGRYPAERIAAGKAAAEGEAAGGAAGVTVPGGAIRMPANREEWGKIGMDVIPSLATQLLFQRLAGPLAGRLAPPVAAAIRAGAGVAGASAGEAGRAAVVGEPVGPAAIRGAAYGAGGEALGYPLGKSGASLVERGLEPLGAGLRWIGRRTPGISKLFEKVPGADEAIRMLAEEGDGSLPTLGQVSESPSVIWMEAMGQRAIGSGMSTIHRSVDENAKGIAGRFVSKFMQQDRVEAGQLLDDMLQDRLKHFREASSLMYAPIDQRLGSAAVPTQSLKNAADKLLQTRIGLKGGKAGELLSAIAELPDTISFAKASAIRSDLLRVNRAADELFGGQAKGIASDLSSVIDSEMEGVAKQLSPSLAANWRAAQEFYKRGARLFDDDVIGAIARQEPETMVQYLYDLPQGKVRRSAIERLREIAGNYGQGHFGESDVMEPLRGHFIKELFKRSASDEALFGANTVNFVNGRYLRKTLAGFDKGELDAILGSANAQKLADIARMLEIAQKRAKNIYGTSGLPSVVLLQAGATFGIWQSDMSYPAKAVALGTVWHLGPRAVTWVLKDPQTVKLLASDIATHPPGTNVAAKAAAQFTARMMAAQRIFGSDEVRPERGKLSDQPLSLTDPSRRATTFTKETPQ